MHAGVGVLANALSENGMNAIHVAILMAVLGYDGFSQMAKIGYGITTDPNFASFLVEFTKEAKRQYNNKRYQAHKAEVERIMEIPEGQQTDEEIDSLTDDADAKERDRLRKDNADAQEAKRQYDSKRCQAHKAEVERIMGLRKGSGPMRRLVF